MKKLKLSMLKIGLLVITNIIISLFFIHNICLAQDFETKVEEYINAHVKIGNFSGSVLIAQNGEVLLSKGYGMANLEYDIQNSPKTRFRLGSVTKQFTAMGIMQLQEKGMINVKDYLNKYIPDYPGGSKITIHHLMTHTAGIPEILSLSEFHDVKTIKSDVLTTIELFKNLLLEFNPGEMYKYSNSGYIILGYIIEKVSGKSYGDYIKDNIFKPLGMNNSGFDNHSTVIKNRASGYSLDGSDIVNAPYLEMSHAHGGGGLYSTTEDMYLWDRALYTEKLVKKSTLSEIFTPFKDNYGYGWRISEKFNRINIRHGGGIEGFQSYISRYVEEDVCIIALCNLEYGKVSQIQTDLAAILFGEKYDIPVAVEVVKIAPEILSEYAGTYEFAPENNMNVFYENGKLFIAPPGQPKVEIFPESETVFIVKAFNAKITFVKNDNGNIEKMVFSAGGNEMPAKKIK